MSRPMRADARRNRTLVLEVASEAFATEGLSVSVHEIARRAGVGTGTVSRHFPTKEALFRAVLLDRVAHVVQRADALGEGGDPGEAFFAFFSVMVEEGTANRGVVDALAGTGYDFEADAAESRYDVMGSWGRLLEGAQRAGAVRDDVSIGDVKALLAGCLDRERHTADTAARARMLSIVRAGLRA